MSKRVQYVPRDPADIDRLRKMRQRWREHTKQLERALVHAVNKRGHDDYCSAKRGLDSECHCGWVKIKAMVKEIEKR